MANAARSKDETTVEDHGSTDSGLLKVTYVKSSIGYKRRQKDTVRSLGLKHLGDSAIQADLPAVRGMIHAVRHLVTVEPVEMPAVERAGAPAKPRRKKKEEPA
jgi:large subunit ribosomal protein L30